MELFGFKNCWWAALIPLGGRMRPAGRVFEAPATRQIKNVMTHAHLIKATRAHGGNELKLIKEKIKITFNQIITNKESEHKCS